MKRMVLAAIAVLVLTALPASAAPSPLHFHFLGESQQSQNPVEQQTDWPYPDPAEWVVNPFGSGCAWDADDKKLVGDTDGYLLAGQQVVQNECVVADAEMQFVSRNGLLAWWTFYPRRISLNLSTPSPRLDIRMCFSPQDRCFQVIPRLVGNRYHYDGCATVGYAPGDPAMSEIPGSRGGIGLVTTVTLTVSNPTTKRIRDISADLRTEGGFAAQFYCSTQEEESYPFRWYSND